MVPRPPPSAGVSDDAQQEEERELGGDEEEKIINGDSSALLLLSPPPPEEEIVFDTGDIENPQHPPESPFVSSIVHHHSIKEETTLTASLKPQTSEMPLLQATVVDEGALEAEMERRVQERMIAGDAAAPIMVDAGEAVLLKEGEDEDSANGRKGRFCILLAVVVVLLALVIGLSVGLTQKNNGSSSSSSNNNAATNNGVPAPTRAPTTLAPTSGQCDFCYGTSKIPEGLESIILSQVPFVTCQSLHDSTIALSRFDEACAAAQARASLQCGCPNLPPVPENATCTLCDPGFVPIPRDVSAGPEECRQRDSYIRIAGGTSDSNSTTVESCDQLRYAAVDCLCQPQIDATLNSNDDCLVQLAQIAAREGLVEDTTIPRTYILCPNTIFQMGRFVAQASSGVSSNSLGEYVGGDIPINLRSNARVICGVDARKENNCTLQGGTNGMLSLPGYVFPGELVHENLWVQGLTFRTGTPADGPSPAVYIMTPTSVTFVDCVFEDLVGPGSVIANHMWVFPPAASIAEIDNQTMVESNVVVDGCIFKNNTAPNPYADCIPLLDFVEPLYENYKGADAVSQNDYPLVITNLEVRRSFFVDNRVEGLIDQFTGGSLTLVDNCFEDNILGFDLVYFYDPYDKGMELQGVNTESGNHFNSPAWCFTSNSTWIVQNGVVSSLASSSEQADSCAPFPSHSSCRSLAGL